MEKTTHLLNAVDQLLANTSEDWKKTLTHICELLQKEVAHYDWVGFYFSDFDTRTLHLKAFAGIPTDHTTIPFGKGICGQVAESNKNFVVPDVHAQDNYLACSLATKSEIVVPVYADEKLVGQIDIDSHQLDPFTAEDHELLEWVAEFVADRL